jgi:hypothetical protein
MTAIICVTQRKHGLVHLVTDAAIYRHGEGVVAFGSKVRTIPHWPGVLTTAGSSAAASLFADDLSQQFSTWDEFAESDLSRLAKVVTDWGLSHASVVLVGISEKRGPESYTFQTTQTLPPGTTQEEAEANEYFAPSFKLVKLPDTVMTPVPPADVSLAANYEGIDVDADPSTVVWSMRKVLEMQRDMPLPGDIGGIGGFATLTTVSAEGVSQRIVEQWPGDRIGAPLRPAAIDWAQWHIDNPKPGAPVSRLKREMLERKARKLRLV